MHVNILIAIAIGLLSYGLTLYFNHNNAPNIAGASATTTHAQTQIDSAAPDFTFKATNGQEYALKDAQGKIVILNFWASWCAPCVKEFPALLELAAQHTDDVVLIAVSSDIDEESMLRFLGQMKNQGHETEADNVLIGLDADNRITRQLYQTYRLPETYIIDRSGVVRDKLIGAEWTIAQINKIIARL